MNIDTKELEKQVNANLEYWAKPRRAHWDEWNSPVGLSLGWAIFIIPLGIFLYLLHLSGLL